MSERVADYPINPLFLERWSPRAFDGSLLAETDILTLLEAARWSPSSFNAQPWRFYYALRETPGFARLLDLLIPANRTWAANSSAPIILASDISMPGAGAEISQTHSFDAGAAWASLALQATSAGLHTHAMAGFDRARAKAELAMPETVQPDAAIAVGRRADPATLPERLRAREAPNMRKSLSEIAFAVE